MTYNAATKGLGIGRLPVGIKEVYARNQNYTQYQQQQSRNSEREKLFQQNAPKNPIKRFFYNVEKRRLGK